MVFIIKTTHKIKVPELDHIPDTILAVSIYSYQKLEILLMFFSHVISDGPNRYPYNPYYNQGNQFNNPGYPQNNPGVLIGPGGPTGFFSRPPAYAQNYLNSPLYGNGPGGPGGPGGLGGPGGSGGPSPFYGNGYNPGFGPYPNTIPFNSKSGSGISADESTEQSQKQEQKKL